MNSSKSGLVRDEKKEADEPVSDAVLWSENPEKAYFQSMIEDNKLKRIADGKDMDDSIIGNETLASLMEAGQRIHKRQEESNTMNKNTMYVPTDDDMDSMPGAPKAPIALAIVGLEDDLSTIANDSVAGQVLDPHMMIARGDHAQLKQRDFKEYTPEKKKKRADSDGGDTAPETPPGVIRVGGKKQPHEKEDEKSKNSLLGEPGGMSQRSKRIYVFAVFVACLLLASVAGLAVILMQLRAEEGNDDDQSPPTSGNQGNLNPFQTAPPTTAWAVTTTSEPTAAPVPAPTAAPATAPTAAPVTTTTRGPTTAPMEVQTQGPTRFPTLRPTAGPTSTPEVATLAPSTAKVSTNSPSAPPVPVTASPTDDEPSEPEADFIALLANRGDISIREAFEDRDSAQYLSFVWVTSDPEYWNYGPDRAIQRFVLGVLGLSLSDSDGQRKQRNLQFPGDFGAITSEASILSDWFSPQNECNWFTSKDDDDICNSEGMYQHLELRRLGLAGTIPMELSLLSNSLETLRMDGNQLYGSIPPSFGKLSQLTRLQLTSNALDGPIPTELGQMNKLLLLGLSRNSIVGTLPSEFGLMTDLRTLDVARNSIRGTIPPELGSLIALEDLALSENRLMGTIPEELEQLELLERLELDHNMLTGEMPREVCRFRNLEELRADCVLVDCDCCTQCGNPDATVSETPAPVEGGTASTPTAQPVASGPQPTSSPVTSEPTTSPTPNPTQRPTVSPTPLPTGKTTSEPTECEAMIEAQRGCFQPGDSIRLDFKNCNPRDDDWIALFLANPQDSGFSPILWLWTCGTQGCQEASEGGTLTLTEQHTQSDSTWPLDNNEYVLFLFRRDSGGNYRSAARSAPFDIQGTC